MKTLFALLLLILSLGSCRTTKDAAKAPGPEVLSLVHGTSFGHCVGYCMKEVAYTKEKITFKQSSRQEENPEKISDETNTATFGYEKISSMVDYTAFAALPETIGCPDCADGGAEFIEITTASGTRRVTFEAGKIPEGMEKLLELLRDNKQKLDSGK